MPMTDEEVRITFRLPGGLRDRLAAAAVESGRSMNAEIIARLQTTLEEPPFDVRSAAVRAIVKEAVDSLERAKKDMAHQVEVLKGAHDQQTMSMHLLELIANTDGQLKPEFMEMLRGMLARRGQDAGFPEEPTKE